MKKVTFKVEQNSKWLDWRVAKYLDGVWVNERSADWSKTKAELKAREYRKKTKSGMTTMSDSF